VVHASSPRTRHPAKSGRFTGPQSGQLGRADIAAAAHDRHLPAREPPGRARHRRQGGRPGGLDEVGPASIISAAASHTCSRRVRFAAVSLPLSAAAVLALLDAITPRYRVAVALGVGLGLREGEAFGLTVRRVDFLRRKIQVLSQAQRGQLAVDLKTAASTRTIPADEWVLNEISAHIRRFGTGPGEVIVTNRLGKVARRNSFGDRWRLAVADARTCGKPPKPAFEGAPCSETCADPAHCLPKGTRFHDLRHFYASTLIAANLNPKVIQARLGHATISETMDTYGHLFPDSEDLGRGAIDAIFAVALTEQERNQETR
jgi:integrase